MRKISPAQIAAFSVMLALALALGTSTGVALANRLPLGQFYGVATVALALLLIYAYTLGVYRTFLYLSPLAEGEILPRSKEEFVYHVYLLFNLVLFYPLTRSLVLPVPLMRLVYLALGARLGANTYSGGTILDPPLTTVGSNTIIGHDALLFSHVMEGNRLALAAVRIGNNVTVGAKAVIMPGVRIEDGAVIAVGAVVAKGSHIGPGEHWAGIPARPLRRASSDGRGPAANPPDDPAP